MTSHLWRRTGIIKPLAHRADTWYDSIHGSSGDDPVCIWLLFCGDLTIPYLGLIYYCLLKKENATHSLGRPSRSDFVQSQLFRKRNNIDLVFYNRLLHCNVIVELKNNEFKHEDLGQLNAYVAYYKKNEMTEGDNPPVGILLCTDKGSQMVEYALSGMDNKLFVSTYMLHLPDKKQLKEFMLKEMQEMGL